MTEYRKQIYEKLGFQSNNDEVKIIDELYTFKYLHDTFRIVMNHYK